MPVKRFSERVPQKNTKPFWGELSLLDVKLLQLTQLFSPEKITVFSEDPDMVTHTLRTGVRFQQVNVDVTRASFTLQDFLQCLLPKVDHEFVMTAFVTTPFMNRDLYRRMISCYFANDAQYDSLIAVARVQSKFFDLNARPTNFGLGCEYTGTQNIPPLFAWIRGASIMRTELAKELGVDLGRRPHLYEVDRIQAVDIDTEADWNLARALCEGNGGESRLGLVRGMVTP